MTLKLRDSLQLLTTQLFDACVLNDDCKFHEIFRLLDHNEIVLHTIIKYSRDHLGQSILHICCSYGSWTMLNTLFENVSNLDINMVNELDNDNTPLHKAMEFALLDPLNGKSLVQYLLFQGANPLLLNSMGQKPVDVMLQSGLSFDPKMVHFLNDVEDLMHWNHNKTVNQTELLRLMGSL